MRGQDRTVHNARYVTTVALEGRIRRSTSHMPSHTPSSDGSDDAGGRGGGEWGTLIGIAATSTLIYLVNRKLAADQAAARAKRALDPAAMAGRRVVVTGANTGIGYATAEGLARRGAEVVLGCRDRLQCEEAVAKIKGAVGVAAKVVAGPPLDLADLNSIERFAAAVSAAGGLPPSDQQPPRGQGQPLDVLVNNAGCMVSSHALVDVNGTSVERTFAVNHLGTMDIVMTLIPWQCCIVTLKVCRHRKKNICPQS